MCSMCSHASHMYIDGESNQITYSRKFCDTLITDNIAFLKEKYVDFFEYILIVGEIFMMITDQEIIEPADMQYYAAIIPQIEACAKSKDPKNCDGLCKEFKVNSMTYIWDGEKLMIDTFKVKYQPIYTKLLKEMKKKEKPVVKKPEKEEKSKSKSSKSKSSKSSSSKSSSSKSSSSKSSSSKSSSSKSSSSKSSSSKSSSSSKTSKSKSPPAKSKAPVKPSKPARDPNSILKYNKKKWDKIANTMKEIAKASPAAKGKGKKSASKKKVSPKKLSAKELLKLKETSFSQLLNPSSVKSNVAKHGLPKVVIIPGMDSDIDAYKLYTLAKEPFKLEKFDVLIATVGMNPHTDAGGNNLETSPEQIIELLCSKGSELKPLNEKIDDEIKAMLEGVSIDEIRGFVNDAGIEFDRYISKQPRKNTLRRKKSILGLKIEK